MNEYGRFRVVRTLPKYVEDQVKCMRTDPWPGVHAAAVIINSFTSNFVELKDGIISRSVTLPEIKENTIHKIEVLPSELGWFYVLFSEETVFLISGQKFQLEKTFENVLYSGIQNFMGDPCKPLLFIEHSNGESILTDGYKNYDLKQTWPPNENKSVVQETLSKRLKIASNHAEDGEHRLRVLKNLVQDSVRSLADSYSWNSSFKEDRIASLFHPSRITEENKENDVFIQVTEKNIKVLQDVFVCILEFKSTKSLNKIALQCCCEESIPITTKSSIFKFNEEDRNLYPACVTDLPENTVAYAMLQVPTSAITLHPSQQLQFNLVISTSQGSSKVEVIKLSSKLIFSQSRSSSVTPTKDFLHELLSLAARGCSEKLKISTQLGNLANLETILEEVGFEKSPNKFGFHCWKRGETFDGTALIFCRSSPQNIIGRIYSLNYSKLSLFIQLLKTKLPCDTIISLCKS